MKSFVKYILCLFIISGAMPLANELYACGSATEMSCHDGDENQKKNCCASDTSEDGDKDCCKDCSCCTSGIAASSGIISTYELVSAECYQLANISFVSSYYQLFPSPIWQPPQLAS